MRNHPIGRAVAQSAILGTLIAQLEATGGFSIKAAHIQNPAQLKGGKMIKHSMTEWAQSLGVDRKTLAAGLSRAGIAHKAGEPITALDIKTAIMGDEKAEKVRNLKLDADLKQIEKDKAEGRLYEPEIVQSEIDRALGSVRQAILQAQAELPPRCNPQDHATARKAIDQWVLRFFKWVRQEQTTTTETTTTQ